MQNNSRIPIEEPGHSLDTGLSMVYQDDLKRATPIQTPACIPGQKYKRKVQDIIGDKLADGIIDGTIANGSSIVLSYTDELVIQFGISLGKESDKPGRIEIDPKDLISNHIGGKV